MTPEIDEISFSYGTTNKKDDNFFLKYVVLPNLILVGFCIIGIYAYSASSIESPIINFFEDINPIYYIIIGILGVQFLVYRIGKYNSNKVIKIGFKGDQILLNFKKGSSEDFTKLKIHLTEIKLVEIRNYKSFFIGLQIYFFDNTFRKQYILFDKDWGNQRFEEIYTEYKKRKGEKIPENEKDAFKQLQIMNGTYINKNVG